MTSLPFYLVAIIESDTPVDYEFKSTGFSTTVGSHMSRNLNVRITLRLLIAHYNININILVSPCRMASRVYIN